MHLKDLNDKQKEAVLHKTGPLLIIAGAGAGKTKTLVSRIIELVKSGIPLENIVAVTFTNKAAQELKERLKETLGISNFYGNGGFIGTFHSLGVRIIKENHSLFGLPKYFSIADESDVLSLIKNSMKKLDIDIKQYEPKKIRYIISQEKGKGKNPENYEQNQNGVSRIVKLVWEEYEKQLKKEGALDFDDLLVKTTKLLKENVEIRKSYEKKWTYLHVDEYQDTNKIQYEMIKLLSGENKNICVVGDSDQCVYSWRGADITNILNFEKDYNDAKVVFLEENYRSTKTILSTANEVIKKNTMRKEKNLFTSNEQGDKITIVEAGDETTEALFVARQAKELLARGVSGKEIAVLYRANFQSRVLEESMIMENIPYQLLGVKFFERKEIKDTMSYLRASLNRDNISDIKRIINFPARGLGKKTIEDFFSGNKDKIPAKKLDVINDVYSLLGSIGDFALKNKPSDTIRHIIIASGLEKKLSDGNEEDIERLENIRELATMALKYDAYENTEGLEKLMEDASLESDQDGLLREDYKNQAIRLMTIHASKGLEFEYVFLVGMEQDLFPHKRMGERQTKEEEEEERRLCYVAITRARKKLYLIWSGIRTIFGRRQINTPSEFLYDIPEELIEREYQAQIEKVINFY